MALSAITIRRLASTQGMSVSVQDAEVLYKGALVAIGSEDHATSGKVGRAYAYSDENGAIFGGIMTSGGGSGAAQGADSVTGDATSAATLLKNQAALRTDSFQIDAINVTGASAATDVGKYVYATDDDTLTLTRPTVGCPIGFVLEYRASGTSCRVQIFSVETVMAFAAGGCAQARMCLGTWEHANMADGNIMTGLPMIHGGTIVQFHAHVTEAPTASTATVTLNLEIGGTNVGPTAATSIVVDAADPVGTVVSSAAISVNNKFSEGDLLDVEAASTTAGTAGAFTLFVDYIRGPGL